MTRLARKKSSSGIYHVMLRGNERKAVFMDEADKNRFVEIMLQKRETAANYLYAYCVMDNHVHMVVRERENGQELNTLMKRIGVSYATYFNKKYNRVGHVFQDRYKSEVIEDDAYLLSVIRYIHQNPVKAGLVSGEKYKWSSYVWYLGRDVNLGLLPEMESILDMLDTDRNKAIQKFKDFHNEEEQQSFIDVEIVKENECDAATVIEKFLRKHRLTKEELKQIENREAAIELVRELTLHAQVSGRQTAELLGLNREKVRKMVMSEEPSP